MKTKTALSSIVLSLISLNAFADCTISVGRYQQQQQQQAAQSDQILRGEMYVVIDQSGRFENMDIDQCLDLFESTRKTLESRASTSANRVLIVDFDYRGIRFSHRATLNPPQQQQHYPQQQQGYPQQQQNPQDLQKMQEELRPFLHHPRTDSQQ